VAVLDQLEEIGRPGRRERRDPEVVEDEDVDPGPGGEEPRRPAVGAGQDELVKEPRTRR